MITPSKLELIQEAARQIWKASIGAVYEQSLDELYNMGYKRGYYRCEGLPENQISVGRQALADDASSKIFNNIFKTKEANQVDPKPSTHPEHNNLESINGGAATVESVAMGYEQALMHLSVAELDAMTDGQHRALKRQLDQVTEKLRSGYPRSAPLYEAKILRTTINSFIATIDAAIAVAHKNQKGD